MLSHEKLRIYQQSLQFIAWLNPLLERLPRTLAVHNQLDRASTSTPLNIAEGNGKSTAADRCRFLDNARGSVLECAACLDVLVAKTVCAEQEIAAGKILCEQIVAGIIRLIQTLSPARIHEDPPPYQTAALPTASTASAATPRLHGMPLEWDEPVEE